MANRRQRKKRWNQQGGTLECALCGKILWARGSNFVMGNRGAVCNACLNTGRVIVACKQEERRKLEKIEDAILSPQTLLARLDGIIAGQEEAKRAVSLAVWKQQLRARGQDAPAGHLLLYGPTGCGKTFLATQAAELAGLPFHVFDGTTLTEAGYRGRDAADILRDYAAAVKDHPKKGFGAVIVDEIDKLAANGSAERQAYCRGTQHSLLKLLEGVMVEGVNSGDLLFILCGAFPGVGRKKTYARAIGFERETAEPSQTEVRPDDFVAFGMERELMGRIPGAAGIKALSEDDLVSILRDKEGSVYREYREFFEQRGIDLLLPDEFARELARRALALGTGARALRAELDKAMEPLMFRLAAGELEGEVVIGA